MPRPTRRVARLLSLPTFGAASFGWAAGLLAIRATASPLALVLSTLLGIVAMGSLGTWFATRPPH